METHAHHLHKAPGKKFWHYFFEFFMLFLAVFCGFWAENMREHSLEKKWEKKLMKSLVEDLQVDTTQLTRMIHLSSNFLKGSDSLLNYSPYAQLQDREVREIYRLFSTYTVWTSLARLTDRTVSQLKNAGYMRLINDGQVSNGILAYEEDKKLLQIQGIDYEETVNTTNQIAGKLFDFVSLNAVLADSTELYSAKKLPDPVFEQAYFREFRNDLFAQLEENKLYIEYMNRVLVKARNLIQIVQKAYSLEEES